MWRVLFLTLCLSALTARVLAQPAVGSVAPNFTLNRAGGGSETLANHLGKVVHLNFFGATCGDCIADGPLSEAIHDMFAGNPDFQIMGIDVWNLPSAYVNSTFRNNSTIQYTLLVQGRTTGYAYNMETNSVPSPTDCEHRGHVIIDKQGIIRYYAIYHPFGVEQQQEMICVINNLLYPPDQTVMYFADVEGFVKLCWTPGFTQGDCPIRYNIYRTLLGDWTDQEYVTSIENENVIYLDTPYEIASYRVVAEIRFPEQ